MRLNKGENLVWIKKKQLVRVKTLDPKAEVKVIKQKRWDLKRYLVLLTLSKDIQW